MEKLPKLLMKKPDIGFIDFDSWEHRHLEKGFQVQAGGLNALA
jgi:hypothetical protein